jgi:hypothetical protein
MTVCASAEWREMRPFPRVSSRENDPRLFATHSLRRTTATSIHRRTDNLRAVLLSLGHTKIESTVRYLGIEVDETRAQASLIGSLMRKVAPPLTFSALIVPL